MYLDAFIVLSFLGENLLNPHSFMHSWKAIAREILNRVDVEASFWFR